MWKPAVFAERHRRRLLHALFKEQRTLSDIAATGTEAANTTRESKKT
jgi:hypothetical protein